MQTVPSPSTELPVGPEQPYRLEVTAVAEAMVVDPATGLDPAEASQRLEVGGPNRLTEVPPRPRWLRFLDQFRSGIVYVLVVAAVLAALVGDAKDPIIIALVLLGNAVLGYVQEARAENALAVLRSMLVSTVRVRRGGRPVEVPADEVVPGDVVLLEAGDRVPADGRLVLAARCSIDESSLTGESVPVDKVVAPVEGTGPLPVGDRINAAFMNTTVVRGRAELLVTATGMDTEMGRVAGLMQQADVGLTPLQRQLDRLGRTLAAIAVVAAVAVLVLQLLRGEPAGEAALAAVALLVAAIPEGLPAVVTVTLAVGVAAMARRNAIVKRLPSVETLGSTSVICSDKTGTLTMNRMQVREVVSSRRDETLVAGVLCNDAVVHDGELVGDPTEGALVEAAVADGVDPGALRSQRARLGEVPFDSTTKYMATVHPADDATEAVLYVKGAPDVLLARSTGNGADGSDWLAENDRLARQGMRVLAVASRPLPADWTEDGLPALVEDLEVLGLFGIVDPPRPEAAAAVARCREAGIRVTMITGDHAVTAGAIARELGIDGRVVTGAELDDLSDEELATQVDGIGVCARVSPEHKVRVVQALRANGRVVAMTGDGVNDAAALRNADIGVAMGITGTEVTKEAGDMVLADDDFATIVGAVERGRTIYANIVKFVRFQLTTNLGAIFTMVGAGLVGLPVPFTAIQVLFVNLIADGPPAMTLGVDPPAPDVMRHAPRDPDAPILSGRRLSTLLLLAATMAIGTLGVYIAADDRWGAEVAATMAFSTFVLFQLWNVFNARQEHASVFSRYAFANPKVWMAVGGVAVLQVLAVTWGPLQGVFDTVALTPTQWALCAAVSSSVLWVDEIRKLVRSRLPRRSEP